MISLDQPSMVCNDQQILRDRITCFRMWNSWEVPEIASSSVIITHIGNVARSAPGGKLRHLVINCHGLPGRMFLGGWVIRHDSVGAFKALRGRIGRIWLVSCQVAGSEYPGPDHMARARSLPRVVQAAANAGVTLEVYVQDRVLNGTYLCRAMATATGAYVTAGIMNQSGDGRAFLPYGMIDRFEGMEMTWGPTGVMTNISNNAIADDGPQ